MNQKTVHITDMDLSGRGIGKFDGKAVFIPGAVIGDTVTFETVISKKRYDTGKLFEIITPSSFRRDPECIASDKCGGCVFMNVTRDVELDVKKRAVESAFRRSGLKNIGVSGILSGKCHAYRNKAVFHRGDNNKYGFFSAGSNKVYSPDSCMILPDSFIQIKNYTEDYFRKHDSLVPNSIMIRLGDNGIMVAAEVESFGASIDFLKTLKSEFSYIISVYECIGYPTDSAARFRLTDGDEFIEISFMDNRLRISPRSFFQINNEIAEAFCNEIIKELSPVVGDLILDLYCGIGTIGLSVARAFKTAKIIGIEINDSAVKDARVNCSLSGITNAEFICRDAGSADYNGLMPHALIVDPPRYGLSDSMIKNILKISPKKLIYMSCDPGTLAGNSVKLTDGGYRITKCIAGDMFPFSPHVETLCIFEKI
ncbi:MAG: 23S rRNA (uracil(1939)-C(5))-methyltransferase RlmD [Ruminococcaceae bacterium]|nr:23S rRNA (uracil(1939)-C(5))-methyltransferase RlmD [Oscillospiraceae bacterium]